MGMSRVANKVFIILVIALLMALPPLDIHDVSGLTCYVPMGVPDVSTALSLGCTEIILTGDVVDSGQASLTGVGMGFPDIIIRGNGYRLVVSPPATPYLSLQDFPSLRIDNLVIQVVPGSGTIFNLVNTTLYLVNVSVSSSLAGRVFSQVDHNVSAYLENVNATNSGGVATFLYQWSFPIFPDPVVPGRTIFRDVNVSGYQYILYSSLIGNYSLVDVWTDGSSLVRPNSMSQPIVEVYIANYTLRSDPFNPPSYGLFIDQIGFDSDYLARLDRVDIMGPFREGLLIYFGTPGAVDIRVSRTSVVDPTWSASSGIFILNGRGILSGDPVRINVSTTNIYGAEYGMHVGNVVLYPIPLGPSEEAYYYVDDVTVEASVIGLLLTTTLNSRGYAWITNSVIGSNGYGILYFTADEAYLKVLNTNTSSALEGLTPWIYNVVGGSPWLDLETMWWFDDRRSGYPYSFSVIEYPFYDGEPSVSFNISYSLIDRFNVLQGQGIFYETVYNPYGSLGSPRSIWTLNVQVLSSYTGLPVSGIRIDYWEDGVYVGSAYTGGDGNSYFTFDYVFDSTDPFIQDLDFSISLSYFSGYWSYRLDFGILTTLPSWYDKIILRLAILAIKGYGMLDHIPALMTLMGDRGVILLFADAGSLIRFLSGDRDVPYKLLRVYIHDMSDYGTYLVVEATLENHLAWRVPVRMWILPRQGILRIHGPSDAVFYFSNG